MCTSTTRAVRSTLFFTLATLGVSLAACADPTPTAPEAPSASAAARSAAAASQLSTPRALAGECVTTFAAPQLPLPPVLHQEDTGTCQLTRLGRSTLYSAKEINFAAGTQVTTEMRITAANGDVLRAVGVGTNAPGGPGRVNFSATMTFTGGTGRFEHATGQAHIEGVANLVTRTTTLTLDGWVAYDAADRSGS